MPSIVNLGTTERLESPLSGLSEALSTGIQASIDMQTLKQRERERATREKLEGNALASQLVDQELRKREQDIQNVRKTHEMFSMWWNGMDEQQKAIARTSEQYKELQKFFKSFKDLAPGLVADDGSIVASAPEDIFKRKLDERSAQSKLAVSQGKATKEDIALLELTEGDKDMVAKSLTAAAEQLTASEAKDPRSFIDKVRDFFSGFRRKPTQTSDALSQPAAVTQPPITQPQQPVLNPATNALQDPLGIYGR